MNIYQFMGEHPFLTFFLAFMIFGTITDSIGHIANIFRKRK